MQISLFENQSLNMTHQPLLQQCNVSGSDFDDLPLGIALELENKMAIGSGNFLVKIWFESSKIGCRNPDLVQAFTTLKEAKDGCQFLKEINGVDACYIVRLKPYDLVERVIRFPSDR